MIRKPLQIRSRHYSAEWRADVRVAKTESVKDIGNRRVIDLCVNRAGFLLRPFSQLSEDQGTRDLNTALFQSWTT
jgi:hypothetical protein